MKIKKILSVNVSLYFSFKTPEKIKVKAHKRIRNGKVETVRSHYRRVVER